MTAQPERLMEAEELADLLGIKAEEVKRRSSKGEFPHVRIGRRYRYSVSDYEAIVAAHHKAATTAEAENVWGVRRRGRAS